MNPCFILAGQELCLEFAVPDCIGPLFITGVLNWDTPYDRLSEAGFLRRCFTGTSVSDSPSWYTYARGRFWGCVSLLFLPAVLLFILLLITSRWSFVITSLAEQETEKKVAPAIFSVYS
jgi:hypothetical protein